MLAARVEDHVSFVDSSSSHEPRTTNATPHMQRAGSWNGKQSRLLSLPRALFTASSNQPLAMQKSGRIGNCGECGSKIDDIVQSHPASPKTYLLAFLNTSLSPQDSTTRMAEIVGLAASIIAIGTAADALWNTAKDIRRLAKALGAARQDIRKFASEIEEFSVCVGSAHLSLHGFSEKPQAQTKVLDYIQRKRLFKRVVAATERVMISVDEIWPRLESLESPIPIIERFKWVRRRDQIQSLGPKMERVKSSLQLVVSVVTLEMVLSQKNSPETSLIIERLKREIICKKEKIVELKKELRRARSQQSDSDYRAFTHLQTTVEDVLIVGEAMVDQGRVPDLNYSPASSSSSSRRRANPRYAVPIVSRSPPMRTNMVPREFPRARTPRPVEATVVRAAPYNPTGVMVYNEEPGHETSSTRSDESSYIEIRALVAEPQDSHPGESPSIIIPSESSQSPASASGPSREGDYLGVHPTNHHLNVGSSLASARESVKGYIETPTGWQSTVAPVDAALSQNLISLGKLEELGLEFQPPDQEIEDFRIVFDNGSQVGSIGTVVVDWSERPEAFLNTIRFRVPCLVYDHDEKSEIVFGGPFLRRRKHYLRSDAEMGRG